MRKIFISSLVIMNLGGCQVKDRQEQANENFKLDGDGFDRTALLSNLALHVVIPKIEKAVSSAQSLTETLELSCGAPAPENRGRAQAAWKTLMKDWQHLEAFQFGPVAEDGYTLRNKIYSWPNINRCNIDKEVLNNVNRNIVLSQHDSRKGLGALEYLLFTETLDHSCGDSIGGLEPWVDLSNEERIFNRCRYALAVSVDLKAQLKDLEDRWSRDESGYSQVMIQAETYEQQQSILNKISDSLFYLDQEVKDVKLGAPIGLSDRCKAASCPEFVEFSYSKTSLDALLANLQGFQAIFDGRFFDDPTPLTKIFALNDNLPLVDIEVNPLTAEDELWTLKAGENNLYSVEGSRQSEKSKEAKHGQDYDNGSIKFKWLVNSKFPEPGTIYQFKVTITRPGFDEYLRQIQQVSLAARMKSHIEAAVDQAKAMAKSGSLHQMVQNSCDDASDESPCSLHRNIKKVTDDLKSEFINALELKMPRRASGDND